MNDVMRPVSFDHANMQIGDVLDGNNINNLTILRDYLERLPEDYKDFEMLDFLVNDTKALTYARTGEFPCGTPACAIGHGIAAGIRPEPQCFGNGNFDYDFCFHRYALQFVSNTAECRTSLFEFLFGAWWHTFDNHHWGAAARISWVLNNLESNTVPACHDNSLALYRQYDKRYRTENKTNKEVSGIATKLGITFEDNKPLIHLEA